VIIIKWDLLYSDSEYLVFFEAL